MTSDVQIDRTLAVICATLNDHRVESFDPAAVQEMARRALGGEPAITVDDGGGLHDASGRRMGAIRRAGGQWVADRQNDTAARSRSAVPSQPPQSKLRRMVTKLKLLKP